MKLSLLKRLGLTSPSKENKTYSFIKNLIDAKPKNLALYELSFTHKSNTTGADNHMSNERLEFLGDAVLDTIISDILYKKFPYKSEGELTQYRSNIVKRTSLNKIALSLRLNEMLISAPNANISTRMYGDLLEAFIGAIYLDKGYDVTFRFIQEKIIDNLLSTEDMTKRGNYKSRLLEWGQQNKSSVVFTEEKDPENERIFISKVTIDQEVIAEGKGKTKKESHNDVAHKALDLIDVINE